MAAGQQQRTSGGGDTGGGGGGSSSSGASDGGRKDGQKTQAQIDAEAKAAADQAAADEKAAFDASSQVNPTTGLTPDQQAAANETAARAQYQTSVTSGSSSGATTNNAGGSRDGNQAVTTPTTTPAPVVAPTPVPPMFDSQNNTIQASQFAAGSYTTPESVANKVAPVTATTAATPASSTGTVNTAYGVGPDGKPVLLPGVTTPTAATTDTSNLNFTSALPMPTSAATAGAAQGELTGGLTPEAMASVNAAEGRGISLELLRQLQAQAAGTGGPTAAQQQLQTATNQNLAATQAQIASQRGAFNPALLRQMQAQSGQARQEAAGQSATLRAQEQQSAQQLAAQLGATTAGQELDTATKVQNLATQLSSTNAQQSNDLFKTYIQDNTTRDLARNKAYLDAATSDADRVQRTAEVIFKSETDALAQYRDALVKAKLSDADIEARVNMFNADQQNKVATENADLYSRNLAGDNAAKLAVDNARAAAFAFWKNQGLDEAKFDQNWAIAEGNWKNNIQAIKEGKPPEPTAFDKFLSTVGQIVGIGSAGVKAYATSDKNAKKNIKSAKIMGFLDVINPVSYDYKSEEFGPKGKRYGFLAQDLEKTPQGKSVVVEKDGRKQIDIGQAVLLMMGSMAEMNKKLKDLEK